MKKYIGLILSVLSLLFAGCDKEGDNIDYGFASYSINVVYPGPGSNSELTATLDDEKITGTLFERHERTGMLKVTYQDYTPLEQSVTLQPNDIIQLLLLPDKTIALYDEKSYISFNVDLVLDNGCIAKLNGQPLVNGVTNYIHKDKASGEIEFYKEGEDIPVATIPVVIEKGKKLNIMQSGDIFFEIPADDEPEPTSNKILKARFLYAGDDVLTMDEIRLDFYLLNEFSYEFMSDAGIVGSVTLQKGQFSKYIELDCSFRYPDENAGDSDGNYTYSFHFDIIDPSTETSIVDHTDFAHGIYSEGITTDGMSWDFKKATFVLKDGGNTLEMLKGVSTPW